MSWCSNVVICCEDVLADPKGVEFPQEILLLLTFPEDLLNVGSKFQQVIKHCTQVLIFLNNHSGLPVYSSDDYHWQFSLLVGECHYHLLGLAHIKFQVGVVPPLHKLMKSWAVVL